MIFHRIFSRNVLESWHFRSPGRGSIRTGQVLQRCDFEAGESSAGAIPIPVPYKAPHLTYVTSPPPHVDVAIEGTLHTGISDPFWWEVRRACTCGKRQSTRRFMESTELCLLHQFQTLLILHPEYTNQSYVPFFKRWEGRAGGLSPRCLQESARTPLQRNQPT
jgi:hypothetical protein